MGGTIGRMRSHRPSKRGPDIRRKLSGLQEPNASEKETMETSVATSAIIQPMSKLFSNGTVGPNGYAKRRQIADLFTAKKNAASGKRGGYDDDENKENSLPARRSKKFVFKTASGITIADESLLGDDEVTTGYVRAPERLLDESRIGPPKDVWAFGVQLWCSRSGACEWLKDEQPACVLSKIAAAIGPLTDQSWPGRADLLAFTAMRPTIRTPQPLPPCPLPSAAAETLCCA